MIQALPLQRETSSESWNIYQVYGESMELVEHNEPGASSSSKRWNMSNQWAMYLCYGGDPWLSTLTLQVPMWPFGGLRPCVGRPSSKWRPNCNPA